MSTLSAPMHVVSVMTTQARGGAEYANVDLLDALVGRGARATLITNLPDLVEGTRVGVREIDLGPKLGRRTIPRVATGFPAWVMRLRRALADEAAIAPIDATLLHFKKEQLMTPLLDRKVTGRIVWAEWGPLPLPMRRPPASTLYERASRAADHVIAVSEATALSLTDAGVPAAKITVLPPVLSSIVSFDQAGRARQRAAWGVTDATLVVGCVSRLGGGKRVDVLIDAIDHLPPDVLVVIAGDGDDAGALREQAARHGDRVRFIPSVRGHVNEVLSAFDVQVFAPQEQEGLPRSLMLGMLMGLPVVATGQEGVADLLEPAAIVEPAHDPRALGALLSGYQTDTERRRREGLALQVRARARFDPAITAARAEDVLAGRPVLDDVDAGMRPVSPRA